MLVDFWASWCAASSHPGADAQRAGQARLRAQGPKVVGMTAEPAEDAERSHKERDGIQYAIAGDPDVGDDRARTAVSALSGRSSSIDKRGVVREVSVGVDPDQDSHARISRSVLAKQRLAEPTSVDVASAHAGSRAPATRVLDELVVDACGGGGFCWSRPRRSIDLMRATREPHRIRDVGGRRRRPSLRSSCRARAHDRARYDSARSSSSGDSPAFAGSVLDRLRRAAASAHEEALDIALRELLESLLRAAEAEGARHLLARCS